MGLVGVAAADHLDPLADVFRRGDLDRQAEAVKQLRTQFALFRIAAADDDEAGRMTHAQPVAFNDVLARSRGIEEQVDEVVFEGHDSARTERRRLREAGFTAVDLIDTSERLGLERVPAIVFSDEAVAPAVYGLFRPVLLLPADYTESLSPEEAEHVLLHELAHLKRGDL